MRRSNGRSMRSITSSDMLEQQINRSCERAVIVTAPYSDLRPPATANGDIIFYRPTTTTDIVF